MAITSDKTQEIEKLNVGSFGKIRVMKTCLVCSAKATGCNFGATSCESCKAFFRRNAVREKMLRFCEKNCVITQENRTTCRSCRLKKCFNVGMNKSLILTDSQRMQRNIKIGLNRMKKQATTQEHEKSTGGNNGVQNNITKFRMFNSKRETLKKYKSNKVQNKTKKTKTSPVNNTSNERDVKHKEEELISSSNRTVESHLVTKEFEQIMYNNSNTRSDIYPEYNDSKSSMCDIQGTKRQTTNNYAENCFLNSNNVYSMNNNIKTNEFCPTLVNNQMFPHEHDQYYNTAIFRGGSHTHSLAINTNYAINPSYDWSNQNEVSFMNHPPPMVVQNDPSSPSYSKNNHHLAMNCPNQHYFKSDVGRNNFSVCDESLPSIDTIMNINSMNNCGHSRYDHVTPDSYLYKTMLNC